MSQKWEYVEETFTMDRILAYQNLFARRLPTHHMLAVIASALGYKLPIIETSAPAASRPELPDVED